ncbi:MAG TPA: 2-phospho-L-lactate transferase [Terriglobales bacterium]|nr:2-phospho-L-lactate transferase [Terriglobales bacterium]
MIVVLTGGTGGAKFVEGLAAVLPARELTVIVNTGDDLTWWGLHVSPDLDSITYALAGILSRERGWGVEGDTFHCLEAMRRMGAPAWFQLGDRDLATHVRRTELLSEGRTLSEVTSEIASRLGVETRILPMSDDQVETRVLTADGELSFQEYFVRERYQVAARGVRFEGAERARPAPGVVQAMTCAEAIVIAPSNPITSIGPILAVPDIRQALKQTRAPVAAISPIIGGAALSGPAGELMKTQALPVSIAGVVRCYADFLDLLVADARDSAFGTQVEGIAVRYTGTLMRSEADKAALARSVLGFLRERPVEAAAS